jgi:hypothetical protein
MVERCGSQQLAAGAHSLYIAGFQAGGGVGMQLRYSGPDTAGRKLFVMPGAVPASQRLRSGPRRRPVLSLGRTAPSGAEAGTAAPAQSSLMRSIYELTRRLKMQVRWQPLLLEIVRELRWQPCFISRARKKHTRNFGGPILSSRWVLLGGGVSAKNAAERGHEASGAEMGVGEVG